MEQSGFLGDEGNVAAVSREQYLRQCTVTQSYASRRGIVVSFQKSDCGGFAAAGTSDEGNRRSGFDLVLSELAHCYASRKWESTHCEINPLENRDIFPQGIAEVDVVELDRTFRFRVLPIGCIRYQNTTMAEVENIVATGVRFRNICIICQLVACRDGASSGLLGV